MNIKRRLFVSNLLMIVIPVTVSLAVFFGGLHLYAVVAGLNEYQRNRTEISFVDATDYVRELAEKWRLSPNIECIADDVREFNRRYSDDGRLALSVYGKDGKVVIPQPPVSPEGASLIDQALNQKEPVTLFSRAAVHAQTVGDYRVVLRSGYRFRRPSPPQNYKEVMANGALVSLVCSVFIILITSRFLTQFVFRRIVRAMDTLTYGFHQVRDGNLGVRIDYRGKDEFSEVCADFNEMAGRLLDSVNARQRDEQSRKELIAGISHDLRTPLTSIKAYVEGLEKGVAATPETRKRYIDIIKDKTNDLEHIIDTLFLFSKLDAGEFPYHIERVDLGAVASEVVESLAAEYAARGLDISLALDAREALADIDPMQMRYVMINIFENSVKYKNKERGKMRVAVYASGRDTVLSLTDDGPGVPAEALPRLFDVFYRGDPSRNNPSKGSGLGLAVAAKIVRYFGGAVEAAPALGGGLSIVIAFPARGGDGKASG
ncbi:MAG: HAMP domain-containing histidine kinase [Synergistaceae bacterium]|nr:HAMP domain-containing histidine kinase [Synergistaceae bacterium]